MKISIIGTRGVPANYGGFETFAEEISKNIKILDPNIEITVVCDFAQKEINNSIKELDNINLKYSVYSKSKNPLKFYMDSIFLSLDSNIILSCGLGGGYFSLLTKFSKAKYITNPDGLEWKRSKWSSLKRFALKTMEKTSVWFSDHLICDSEGIAEYIRQEYSYKKKTYTIEYGAYENEFIGINNEKTKIILSQYNLNSNAYHLVVSRLEPENNVDMIIDGYLSHRFKHPLIIVGNLIDTDYVKLLKNKENKQIIFIGGIYNKDELSILRANATSYLHGHSVGGTNPSLLEAMGSQNICICHDNIFNRKTTAEAGLYFKNILEVSKALKYVENKNNIDNITTMKKNTLSSIKNYYNWENMARKYINAFRDIMED